MNNKPVLIAAIVEITASVVVETIVDNKVVSDEGEVVSSVEVVFILHRPTTKREELRMTANKDFLS